MKLGVFTPVFGQLSTPEMLAKVRALGKIEAVELGTGGWPGAAHLSLDCPAERRTEGARLRARDRRRRVVHQRAVVPRQSAPSTQGHGVRRRRAVSQDRPAGVAARCSRRRDLFRLPGRFRYGDASQLGHHGLAARVPRGARLAMAVQNDSVLAGCRAICRRSRREGGARGASRLHGLQRRDGVAAARGGGPEPGRELRSEPSVLAGRGSGGGHSRAGPGHLPCACEGRRARIHRMSP